MGNAGSSIGKKLNLNLFKKPSDDEKSFQDSKNDNDTDEVDYQQYLRRQSDVQLDVTPNRTMTELYQYFPTQLRELYEPLKILKSNRFTVVVLCNRRKDSRKVVIKLHNDISRFENEVKILRCLDHQNYEKVIDFYYIQIDEMTGNCLVMEDCEYCYHIVFPFFEGCKLIDALRNKSSYNEKDAIALMQVALRTVQSFHDHGVIHRNLHLGNFLVNDTSAKTELSLIGWSLSTFTEGFQLKGAVGVPEFMAPEMIENKHYGKPVDMWSLGVILYLLLAGTPPFQNEDPALLQDSIVNGDFDFTADSWTSVSDSAKDLIRHLLDINPHTRYTAAEALNHSWLSVTPTKLEHRNLDGVVVNLKAAAKFRSCVKAIIATNKFIEMASTLNQTRQLDHCFSERYEKIEKIGEGGFAIVWLAQNKVDRSNVAVKIFKQSVIRQKGVKSLYEEVKILSMIRHPNIVRYLDHFKEDDGFYLVMEHMAGGELLNRIQSKVNYSEKEARDIAYGILITIKHLHDKNIFHRDIKPENLLLCSTDDDTAVKLADFGLAKELKEGEDLPSQHIGTLQYMAPEIINRDPYGKPVDMWAFGVVLYILLCGYFPFNQADDDETRDLIERGEYSFDGSSWTPVSNAAKDLIRHLLIVDVNQRYTVDNALAHEWMSARPRDLATNYLTNVKEDLVIFQETKSFRIIVKAVMMINKFKRIIQARQERHRHISLADIQLNTSSRIEE